MSDTNTNLQPVPTNEPNGRREQRRTEQRRDQRDFRTPRNAAEIMHNLPAGWAANVIEPDAEGTSGHRTRLRVMVFENPDKGFKILPFMTVRQVRHMKVDSSDVETTDDMDILPNNVLEYALPAILFQHGKVLETVTELFAEYGKRQASLPPPSKRPLTQRPFEKLAKQARAMPRERQVREQPKRFEERAQLPQYREPMRPQRTADRPAVLLSPLF